MKFDIKEIDDKKVLIIYKKHFLWFKFEKYVFEIPELSEHHVYIFNKDLYLSLYNEDIFILYKFKDGYLDKIKHISSRINFKPVRYLKSNISIESKINNYYEKILKQTGINKNIFIKYFKNNKIYLPDQLVKIDNKYFIILSSYYKKNIEDSFYDIIGIDNESITYGKIPFMGIDEVDIDMNDILPILHLYKVNIDVKTLFYKKDNDIVYPAAITLI